jgi:hypothetical protein
MSLTSYQTAPPRDFCMNSNLPTFRKAATRFLNFLRAPHTHFHAAAREIARERVSPGDQRKRRLIREGLAPKSQVLGSREHDEVADRHISRAGQHENDGFRHVLGT